MNPAQQPLLSDLHSYAAEAQTTSGKLNNPTGYAEQTPAEWSARVVRVNHSQRHELTRPLKFKEA